MTASVVATHCGTEGEGRTTAKGGRPQPAHRRGARLLAGSAGVAPRLGSRTFQRRRRAPPQSSRVVARAGPAPRWGSPSPRWPPNVSSSALQRTRPNVVAPTRPIDAQTTYAGILSSWSHASTATTTTSTTGRSSPAIYHSGGTGSSGSMRGGEGRHDRPEADRDGPPAHPGPGRLGREGPFASRPARRARPATTRLRRGRSPTATGLADRAMNGGESQLVDLCRRRSEPGSEPKHVHRYTMRGGRQAHQQPAGAVPPRTKPAALEPRQPRHGVGGPGQVGSGTRGRTRPAVEVAAARDSMTPTRRRMVCTS